MVFITASSATAIVTTWGKERAGKYLALFCTKGIHLFPLTSGSQPEFCGPMCKSMEGLRRTREQNFMQEFACRVFIHLLPPPAPGDRVYSIFKEVITLEG